MASYALLPLLVVVMAKVIRLISHIPLSDVLLARVAHTF